MLRTELPTELLLKFGGFCVCTLQLMDLEEAVPLDCCRLVKYDEFHDYLERSYEGEEETPMGLLLGGVKSTYMFDLLLETRRPDQVFQCYKPGGKTCSYIYAFSSSPSVLCDGTASVWGVERRKPEFYSQYSELHNVLCCWLASSWSRSVVYKNLSNWKVFSSLALNLIGKCYSEVGLLFKFLLFVCNATP